MPNIQLTNEFIKTGLVCPAGFESIEYCDAEDPNGLVVEVISDFQGEGAYYVRIPDLYGEVRRSRLGWTNSLPLDEAKRCASMVRQKAKQAILQIQEPPVVTMPTLVDFFYRTYRPYAKRLRPKGCLSDEAFFAAAAREDLGTMKLDEITEEDISIFHGSFCCGGVMSSEALALHVKVLKRVFDLAVAKNLVRRNPARSLYTWCTANERLNGQSSTGQGAST